MSLIRADAINIPLQDGTVDLIVTSPPYFALRSYTDGGEHYDGQIGSEPTPQDFLEALWAVLKCSPPDWVSEGPPSYAPATFTHVPDMWNLIAGPRIPDARFVEFQEDREITDTYTGQTFMDMTAWML